MECGDPAGTAAPLARGGGLRGVQEYEAAARYSAQSTPGPVSSAGNPTAAAGDKSVLRVGFDRDAFAEDRHPGAIAATLPRIRQCVGACGPRGRCQLPLAAAQVAPAFQQGIQSAGGVYGREAAYRCGVAPLDQFR